MGTPVSGPVFYGYNADGSLVDPATLDQAAVAKTNASLGAANGFTYNSAGNATSGPLTSGVNPTADPIFNTPRSAAYMAAPLPTTYSKPPQYSATRVTQQAPASPAANDPTQDPQWYWLRPGETMSHYYARIAAANPNLPAPGTTSSTGVVNNTTPNPDRPITSKDLGGATSYNFQNAADLSANQTAAHASAAATAAQIANDKAAYAETAAQKQESDLSTLLQQLNTQEAGKPAYQAEQEAKYGVNSQQATVNDLSAKLATLTNEAAAIKMTAQPNAGVTTAIDNRQRDGALQTNAIASLAVSSLLNAANASLATAEAQANKAVALIFDPIEAQIKASTANLRLIQNDPNTTLQEQQQADARQRMLTAQSVAIAEQKTNLADIFKLATDAASHISDFTPTAQYKTASQALTAIQQAHTKEDALSIAVSTGLTGGGQAYNQISQSLMSARGSDGWTDPNLYARLRASSSVSPTDFDNRFAYLVNPQSYAKLGITAANAGTPSLSGEQLKQFIYKQTTDPAFQAASDQEKRNYILSLGGNPADFGL